MRLWTASLGFWVALCRLWSFGDRAPGERRWPAPAGESPAERGHACGDAVRADPARPALTLLARSLAALRRGSSGRRSSGSARQRTRRVRGVGARSAGRLEDGSPASRFLCYVPRRSDAAPLRRPGNESDPVTVCRPRHGPRIPKTTMPCPDRLGGSFSTRGGTAQWARRDRLATIASNGYTHRRSTSAAGSARGRRPGANRRPAALPSRRPGFRPASPAAAERDA